MHLLYKAFWRNRMKDWMILLAILLSLSIGGFFIKNLLINFYRKRMMKYLFEIHPNLLKLLDSFIVKLLFDPFYTENLRLNFFISNHDDIEIEKFIRTIETSNFTKKQKMSMYQTAFSYFVSNLNKCGANKMMNIIKTSVEKNNLDVAIVDECKLETDIFFDKKLSVLNEIDKRIENSLERDKVGWIVKKIFVLKENNRVDEAKSFLENAIYQMKDSVNQAILTQFLEKGFE